MAVLTSQVEISDVFEQRRARMEELVAELRERTEQVARGGGEAALEKHRSRGKLTARERIDRLAVFRRLEFLGPRRRIRVFFDRSALFFAREEPRALAVRVTWRTDEGARRARTIRHDLDAYRDFPYLEVPGDANRSS